MHKGVVIVIVYFSKLVRFSLEHSRGYVQIYRNTTIPNLTALKDLSDLNHYLVHHYQIQRLNPRLQSVAFCQDF
jgi:hypothetical protein